MAFRLLSQNDCTTTPRLFDGCQRRTFKAEVYSLHYHHESPLAGNIPYLTLINQTAELPGKANSPNPLICWFKWKNICLKECVYTLISSVFYSHPQHLYVPPPWYESRCKTINLDQNKSNQILNKIK